MSEQWEARPQGNSLYYEVVRVGTPNVIAEVFNHDPGAKSLARLIAAAPDLLAAAEYASLMIQDWGRSGRYFKTDALNSLTKALAKARGS